MAANDIRKIYSPIILFSRGVLSVVPEEGLRVLGIFISESGTLIRKASAKRGVIESSGWMLEANGRFREFSPIGARNLWAAPLSPLIQFVKSEFNLTEGRAITVSELAGLLKGVKDDFKEAPQAASLRGYLGKHPGDKVVSERMLREWPI